MNHSKVYKIFDKVHYKNEAQYRQLFHPFNLSKSGFRYTPNEKRVIPKSRARCPLYSTQWTWLLLLISTSAEGIDIL